MVLTYEVDIIKEIKRLMEKRYGYTESIVVTHADDDKYVMEHREALVFTNISTVFYDRAKRVAFVYDKHIMYVLRAYLEKADTGVLKSKTMFLNISGVDPAKTRYLSDEDKSNCPEQWDENRFIATMDEWLGAKTDVRAAMHPSNTAQLLRTLDRLVCSLSHQR